MKLNRRAALLGAVAAAFARKPIAAHRTRIFKWIPAAMLPVAVTVTVTGMGGGGTSGAGAGGFGQYISTAGGGSGGFI